jgi:thiamine transporter ThiT
MAEAAHEYHTGDQDISEQVATFSLVGGMLKWGSLGIAVTLIMLVLWFCTNAGFFSGLITGVILLAVGIYFLRSKPDAEH